MTITGYDANSIAANHTYSRWRRDVRALHRDSDPDNAYTIEVLVVVDEAMRRFHRTLGSDITEYILTLMLIASDVYADPSIGNSINIAVIDIKNLENDLNIERLHEGKSINHMHKFPFQIKL